MNLQNQNNSNSNNTNIFRLLVFIIFLMLVGNCYGQSLTWERSYLYSNWTTGYSVKQTSDGNYIVCGLRTNYGGFITKLNQLGDTLWVRYFPVVELTSIIETNDGNYVAVGYNDNLFIVKLTATGNIIWTRQITETGYDLRIYSFCITNDGNFAIVGGAITYNPSSTYGYFIKLDFNGRKVFSKFIGQENTYIALTNIKQLQNNDFILIGGFWLNNNNNQIYLIRTNSNGDTLWTNNYGTNFIEIGKSVFQTYDKGFLSISVIWFSNRQKRLYFTKTDSSGNLQWSKIYGDTLKYYELHASDCAIKVDYNNTYVITGYHIAGLNSTDTVKCFLLAIDSLGQKIWEKFFLKDTLEISGSSVDLCSDSGYVICGDMRNIPPKSNNLTSPQYLYVLKTNKNGEINPIGINNNQLVIPTEFMLYQSYPNPFNPITNIRYEIPLLRGVSEGRGVLVSIKIYDLLGREVFTYSDTKTPGSYEVKFDGSNLASGMYFYKLAAETSQLSSQSGRDVFTDTKKMVLLK